MLFDQRSAPQTKLRHYDFRGSIWTVARQFATEGALTGFAPLFQSVFGLANHFAGPFLLALMPADILSIKLTP
jgi:hypothetical protein